MLSDVAGCCSLHATCAECLSQLCWKHTLSAFHPLLRVWTAWGVCCFSTSWRRGKQMQATWVMMFYCDYWIYQEIHSYIAFVPSKANKSKSNVENSAIPTMLVACLPSDHCEKWSSFQVWSTEWSIITKILWRKLFRGHTERELSGVSEKDLRVVVKSIPVTQNLWKILL